MQCPSPTLGRAHRPISDPDDGLVNPLSSTSVVSEFDPRNSGLVRPAGTHYWVVSSQLMNKEGEALLNCTTHDVPILSWSRHAARPNGSGRRLEDVDVYAPSRWAT
jgi:hypothetical protein